MDKVTLAAQLGQALRFLAMRLTDGEAVMVQGIFGEWNPGEEYKTDDIVAYGVNDVGDPQLYRVLQKHTSQGVWTPDIAAALYKPFGVTEEGYPEWAQPVGAGDAYVTGDIVSYNGKLYRSIYDNNVWQPGIFGWEEYIL